jgi:hypothetical protein
MANSEVSSIAAIERAIHGGIWGELVTNEHLSSHSRLPTTSAPEMAMPSYVEHCDGATEIGKLSAEAVVREYEATAKEIESLGDDLIECTKRCEWVTRNAFIVTKELNEVAARYRAEAKFVFEQIENCSVLVAEAREACANIKDKLAMPIAAQPKL